MTGCCWRSPWLSAGLQVLPGCQLLAGWTEAPVVFDLTVSIWDAPGQWDWRGTVLPAIEPYPYLRLTLI